MTTEDYLASIKAWLDTSDQVSEFRVVEEWQQPFEGYIRVRMTLTNGDFLEGAEYFVVSRGKHITKRYRYHWMDAKRQHLRKRWDNVPHYPNLPNFPHRIHWADGQVTAGEGWKRR